MSEYSCSIPAMGPSSAELTATVCFASALLHSFCLRPIQRLAHLFGRGSRAERFLHLFGELEFVFGFWAVILLLLFLLREGAGSVVEYLHGCSFTEPLFVFAILVVCSTRPILFFAERVIDSAASHLPLPQPLSFYASALVLGPLFGSFITEPAAMTVTALLLARRLFSAEISLRLKYATLGLLFVNVSIGGTLTPYAAPPVVMVASKWG